MPCPRCRKQGKRIDIVDTWTRDIAYREEAWVHSRLGVYESRCPCQEYFQAENPDAPHHWSYTVAVREAVVNSIVRDHLSAQKTRERFRQDFLLELSQGFVFECLTWADQRFDLEGYFRSVAERFSGVLCIDELYDGDYKIIFATDPQLDETVGFRVVEAATREQVEPFLIELRERGIRPESVMTDDSSLYPDMLQAVWPGVSHRKCVFHFEMTASKAVLRAVRKIAKKLPGKRKRRRGRPSKRGAPRKKVSDRDFVSKNRYLVVKKDENLTEKDRENLPKLLEMHPDLAPLREFTGRLRDLFEPGITQQQARNRRTRLLQLPIVAAYPQLQRLSKRLTGESFEKLISFLRSDDGERTNNHVERRNRGFRMIQKTRYRHRTKARIEQAIRLDLARRSCQLGAGSHTHAVQNASKPRSDQENMAA
jgi:hypothetical protein